MGRANPLDHAGAMPTVLPRGQNRRRELSELIGHVGDLAHPTRCRMSRFNLIGKCSNGNKREKNFR
jgi:hypothetical protein